MAKVDVSESSTLTPEQAWALASDLGRFEEWLTIFGGAGSAVESRSLRRAVFASAGCGVIP